MKIYLFRILFFFLILYGSAVKANTDIYPSLIDATLRYNELKTQLDQIKSQNASLIGRVEALKGKRVVDLSRREKKILTQYNEVNKLLHFWRPAAGLKSALVNRYHKTLGVPADEAKLQEEASFLAFEIIQEIYRLQKKYKINSFPVVHNFLIMLHYKKRGACKHWAEDLLIKIEKLPRKYFTAYWGEAFPGKVTEHNIAVLVPRGAPFSEGLMIDPWRTASRPFWLPVKEDHFYKWQAWPQYLPR